MPLSGPVRRAAPTILSPGSPRPGSVGVSRGSRTFQPPGLAVLGACRPGPFPDQGLASRGFIVYRRL